MPTLTAESNTVAQDSERQLSSKQHDLDTAVRSRDMLLENITTAELIELQGQNSSIAEEIEYLKLKFQNKSKESKYLEKSQKKMKSRWKETVERMKKESSEEIKQLQQQLTIKRSQLSQIQEQLQQKENEQEEKIAEVEEKAALVKQLQEEVEKLKCSFSEQQEEMTLRQIESTAYSLSSERHLEEVKLQIEHAKHEVNVKKKEIETHNQNLAIKDDQISQLSTIIEENETKMAKLQEEALLSENEQKLLKLSLCVKVIRLKEQLKTAEHAKWLSQFKLQKAQERLKQYKSSIPDITKCRVSLPQKTLNKHTLSHLRVCLFDEDGDQCSGSHNIDTKLTLLADDSIVAGTISKPEKDNPGEYVVSFTPTRAGDYDIQVTVNGIPLPSGPLSAMVYNHADPDITKCRVGLPQMKLEKHTLSHLRVCLFDEDGDPCSGRHNIDTKLTLQADDSVVAAKPMMDNPGEYVVSFTPTRAGDCDIQVTVNGTTLPSGPLRVMVYNHAEPDIQNCYATGCGLRGAEKDKETECQVFLLDSDSDPCWMEDDIEAQLTTPGSREDTHQTNLTAELVHCKSKSPIQCVIQNQQNSQYKITYQPTKRGKHQLNIKINGREIQGSPFIIAVTSSPQSLEQPVRVIGNLKTPWSLTTNSQNQIIVTEASSNCVSVFSPEGEKIHSFGSDGTNNGQFQFPRGVTVDNVGILYVVDNNNHHIHKFTSDGKFIQSVGTQGSGELQFKSPLGVSFNPNNQKLYVCDQNNHCVQVLDTDLTYHSTIGRKGTGNGEFQSTVDIAFNSNGDIYITDFNNHRVQVFNQDGIFLRTLRNKQQGQILQYPFGIAVDSSDTVYVSERYRNCISAFTAEGEYLTTFGGKGEAEGLFNCPFGLHNDKNDSLLVCDTDNGRIQIF